MEQQLTIEDLVEKLKSDFDDCKESDYSFFQRLIGEVIEISKHNSIRSNNVIFYGAYSLVLSSRKITIHFTHGRVTHLTSEQNQLLQTYNERSFE